MDRATATQDERYCNETQGWMERHFWHACVANDLIGNCVSYGTIVFEEHNEESTISLMPLTPLI